MTPGASEKIHARWLARVAAPEDGRTPGPTDFTAQPIFQTGSKLYIQEAGRAEVFALFADGRNPILLNELQELEIRNGIRQKVLRGEITESQAIAGLRLMDDDCIARTVLRKPIEWAAVYREAEKLSRRHSIRQICRAIDLLHVAIAAVSEVGRFATADGEQAKLARAAGLKVVDFSR